MIDDENHPEYIAVQSALFQQAAMLCAYEPFSLSLITHLRELCASAREQARKRGIDFPEVAVVYFKQRRLIRLWRREADKARIDGYVRHLIKEMPEMTFDEISYGILRTWPNYIMSDAAFYMLAKPDKTN